jgi:hypothetical protein
MSDEAAVFSWDDLAGVLARVTVRLGGRDVVARLLSAAEVGVLERLYQRPVVPRVKVGDELRQEPEDHDYQRAAGAWVERLDALLVAAAVGAPDERKRVFAAGMPQAEMRAWADDVAPRLLGAVGAEQLARAALAVRTHDPRALEEARKN